MTTPTALMEAIAEELRGNSALSALLGGQKIYGVEQAEAPFPYVTMGGDLCRPGEGATEEHQITLHAWTRQGGHREAHLIAGAILNALDEASFAIQGHRLINIKFGLADIRREADGRTYHALVRFRAVTEPLPETAAALKTA